MKRRQFLQGASVAAASAIAACSDESNRPAPAAENKDQPAAPAVVSSMPEMKWRLTSSFPQSLDTLYGAASIFSKAVAEATDNRFQIQVFAAGEIVPALAAADAVQKGTVEMAQTASYYYFGKDPTFAFGTAVPFGLNARMQNAWMYQGGGIELMNAFYKKFNIHALPGGNTGCQMGGWFRKEVKRVEDLRGLKMRIGGFAGTVVSKLGVVPQQIPGGEVYSSLEKGTIDAAEWVGPYDDEKLGFAKIAPFYYYPGWWEGGAMLHHFFNLDKWNALPNFYKSILTTASAMTNQWMLAKYDDQNPAALQRLLKQGQAKFQAFSPEIMQASLTAALEVYKEFSAKNADFRKVWEAVLAYRNSQYLWWRVAEFTYDDFMIRNRTRT
jgi:TRAP-type mannitol/chloroaromatic compound transport system substrate-binding protein